MVRPFPLLPLVEVGRALGNDEDVGRLEAGREVAEFAPGHQAVLLHGTVIVDEDDVHIRAEPPVLERVVQDDDIGLGDVLVQGFPGLLGGLEFLRMREEPAPFHPVLVHGDGHGRELLRDLQRFVAELEGRSLAAHLLEALGLALVPPGEDGDVGIGPFVTLEEVPEDHLRVRGLSGAAHGDVAHADGGNVGLVRLFPALVVKQVAQGQHEPVDHMLRTLRTVMSSWLMGLFILTAREMGT